MGPELERCLAQLGLLWGLGWRGAWHNCGLLLAQTKGSPGTARLLLPRMKQDQAQLGLLWGPGWRGAWHS